MTDQTTQTLPTNNAVDIAQRAARGFMTLEISVGMPTGTVQNKTAAARVAAEHGAQAETTRVFNDLLGKNQSYLNAVKSDFRAIREYVYAETLSFTAKTQGQQRGPRLVPVAKLPEVLATLDKLKARARESLEAFLLDYDRLVADSRASLGDFAATLSAPSVAEMGRKFYVEIGAPQPLNVTTPDQLKGLNIPADVATTIAAQQADALSAQLENAKRELLEGAAKQAERLAKQLREGTRFHDSLVTDTHHWADMLEQYAGNTDGDPRIMASAALLREAVGPARYAASSLPREGAARATGADKAQKAAGQLRSLEAAPAPAQPAPAAAAEHGEIAVGGVLAELF